MREWRSRNARIGSSLRCRIDRLTDEINTILLVVAIVLLMLDLSRLATSGLVAESGSSLVRALALHPTQDTETAADFQ
jgi:hypothetical protein